MRELIEVRHPDVEGTAWVPRSALGQMNPGWEPVPEPSSTTEPPDAAPADPEPNSESETD